MLRRLIVAAAFAAMSPLAYAQDRSEYNRCLELHAAAYSNEVNTIEDVLIQGADVNCRNKEDGNSTPLMSAAGSGNLDATKALIEHGAAVDARDDHGQTALMRAQRTRDALAEKLPMVAGRFDQVIAYLKTKTGSP